MTDTPTTAPRKIPANDNIPVSKQPKAAPPARSDSEVLASLESLDQGTLVLDN